MIPEYAMQTGGQKAAEKPKVTFPTDAKIVENPSLNKSGKHKPKKAVDDKQPKLWSSPS